MLKSLLSFSALCLCICTSLAQDFQLGIATEYNLPIGKLAWTYKAAPGIQLKGSRVDGDREFKKGFSVALGYTVFQPLADTLYYVVDKGGVGGAGLGTGVYSPYKILQLTLGVDYELGLSKKTFVYLGFGAAYFYGDREILLEDEFGASDGIDETVMRAALIPKAGFGFRLNKNFSVIPYFSYSFMIEVGSTDENAMNYNPDTGAISHFYTPGLSLNYTF